MVQPGTSALFMVVTKVTPDKAIDALSKYGGHVLKTSLPKDAEQRIQEALHGGADGQQGAEQPAEEPVATGAAAS